MLGEKLEVHPRLVVVALEKGPRGKLEQVAIPDLVLGQEVHVVAPIGAADRPVESRPFCQVCLDADDWLDAGVLRAP